MSKGVRDGARSERERGVEATNRNPTEKTVDAKMTDCNTRLSGGRNRRNDVVAAHTATRSEARDATFCPNQIGKTRAELRMVGADRQLGLHEERPSCSRKLPIDRCVQYSTLHTVDYCTSELTAPQPNQFQISKKSIAVASDHPFALILTLCTVLCCTSSASL